VDGIEVRGSEGLDFARPQNQESHVIPRGVPRFFFPVPQPRDGVSDPLFRFEGFNKKG
jgi:hypothetical protein